MSEIVAVCSADQIRLCREVASTSNSWTFFLVKRDLTLTMNVMQHAHIKFKTNIILKNKKTEPPCLMQLISKACQYSKFWNTQFIFNTSQFTILIQYSSTTYTKFVWCSILTRKKEDKKSITIRHNVAQYQYVDLVGPKGVQQVS